VVAAAIADLVAVVVVRNTSQMAVVVAMLLISTLHAQVKDTKHTLHQIIMKDCCFVWLKNMAVKMGTCSSSYCDRLSPHRTWASDPAALTGCGSGLSYVTEHICGVPRNSHSDSTCARIGIASELAPELLTLLSWQDAAQVSHKQQTTEYMCGVPRQPPLGQHLRQRCDSF
jgi:hypothetical protein